MKNHWLATTVPMVKEQLAEFVFIPVPIMGHLPPTVETARRLTARYPNRISATILIIKSPASGKTVDTYIQSLISQNPTTAENNRTITVLELPYPDYQPDPTSKDLWFPYLEAYRPVVRDTLLHRYYSSTNGQRRLAGLVLDMTCTSLIEVGDELCVPSYSFVTAGASFLNLTLYFESLHLDIPEIKETMVEVPGFKHPVPKNVWPTVFLNKDSVFSFQTMMEYARRLRRTKGIIVNTSMKLESSLLQSLSGDHVPQIYPVGPILNMTKDSSDNSNTAVMRWLDSQPPSSVVFLCFGSWGSFNKEQVKEIAQGLERSGQRFLWSLRRPPPSSQEEDKVRGSPMPEEYDDYADVLPEGFLDRTASVGRVTGWTPQVAVLGHKAVGVFMSHCGWNSILESLWFGVPILTWPIYAEQQLNAFVLVKEMGLAVEIRMDYWCDIKDRVANMVVPAEEIERGIRRIMEQEEGEKIRQKVKELSVVAKRAADSGGSSRESMGRFMQDVLGNIAK